MPAGDYFPGINRLLQVTKVWPRIFAQAPSGTLPAWLDEDRLVVLCVGDDALAMVRENAGQIVRLLNRLLDGDVIVTAVDAVEATPTEERLAREMLALKTWLVEFNVGI